MSSRPIRVSQPQPPRESQHRPCAAVLAVQQDGHAVGRCPGRRGATGPTPRAVAGVGVRHLGQHPQHPRARAGTPRTARPVRAGPDARLHADAALQQRRRDLLRARLVPVDRGVVGQHRPGADARHPAPRVGLGPGAGRHADRARHPCPYRVERRRDRARRQGVVAARRLGVDMHVRRPGRDGPGRGLGHRPGRQRHGRTVARRPGPVQTDLHHASMVPGATDNAGRSPTRADRRRGPPGDPRPTAQAASPGLRPTRRAALTPTPAAVRAWPPPGPRA